MPVQIGRKYEARKKIAIKLNGAPHFTEGQIENLYVFRKKKETIEHDLGYLVVLREDTGYQLRQSKLLSQSHYAAKNTDSLLFLNK